MLLVDDIQDRSTTRRNQPCWYIQNNIGLAAINDGFIIEQALYQLLRIHFKNQHCYLELTEVFQDVSVAENCDIKYLCIDILIVLFIDYIKNNNGTMFGFIVDAFRK